MLILWFELMSEYYSHCVPTCSSNKTAESALVTQRLSPDVVGGTYPFGGIMSDGLIPAIMSRRARRAITGQPIARDILETILTAAHLAPSCANSQPWRFVVVDEEPALTQVKEYLSGGNYWAKLAPAVIAVVSRTDLDCQIPDGREYHLFGCGLASMNLMLQATEMGLIAHPIAGFKQAPIKTLLDIPDDFTLITLIILGNPADTDQLLSEKHRLEEVSERSRVPISNVVAWNRFTFSEPPP
ncbi:nitroreductase family protein [Candidatus Bipolaricaulota bacterium]|nr:nitroreductase family protein [Candidatus Bipolaricaulota bacterium]